MRSSDKASKYRLRVTAGPEYDSSTHQTVPVNDAQTIRIENDLATTALSVRIQNYTGYPDTSPTTTPYFTHPLHQKDQYSITFGISFKEPVNGDDLIFGNDFDHSIRHKLPPGFNAALRFVQWAIDPSLSGDAYADKPYLYSPALATWNQFRVGELVGKRGQIQVPEVHGLIVEEGGDGDGEELREKEGIPGSVEGRRGFFQSEEKRKEFVFEEGRVYFADFGNQYLDFNDFTLRLPGFSINALHYVDDKTHSLRYVLKNRKTGRVYLVVVFTLLLLAENQTLESGETEKDKEKKSERFEWEEEPSVDDVE